jgi:hypothetical protein
MLGKRNEARRKAESQALFHQMLKAGKRQVVTPATKKGTRSENKNKAIKESWD